jgi:hypothetical protein
VKATIGWSDGLKLQRVEGVVRGSGKKGKKSSAPDEPMVKRHEASVHPTVQKFLTVSN